MGENLFDRLFGLEYGDAKQDLSKYVDLLIGDHRLVDPVGKTFLKCADMPFSTWSVALLLLTLESHEELYAALCCDER